MNEVYHQITLDEWADIKEKIKRNLYSIAESYVVIGYNLKLARDKELYKQDGYANINEFAEAEFGISKSAVSRFIRIQERYAIGEQLKPEYTGFKRAVLEEMLSLSPEQEKLITPEISREEVRELKHFDHEEPAEIIGIEEAVIRFFTENEEDYEEFIEEDDLEEKVDILNPSGSSTYKSGDIYLWFYDLHTGVKYRIFGKTETMELTWEDFVTWVESLEDKIKESIEKKKLSTRSEQKVEKKEQPSTIPPKAPEPKQIREKSDFEEPEKPENETKKEQKQETKQENAKTGSENAPKTPSENADKDTQNVIEVAPAQPLGELEKVGDEKPQYCPPNINDCQRQEWGTSEEAQAAGQKECKKCWEEYNKRNKILQKEPEEIKTETVYEKLQKKTVPDLAYYLSGIGCPEKKTDCDHENSRCQLCKECWELYLNQYEVAE